MVEYRRNPLIEQFCYGLVTRKYDPEALGQPEVARLVDELYSRFESLLGRNIVEALPAERREALRRKLADEPLAKDGESLARMQGFFEETDLSGVDFAAIFRFTVQELADQFLGTGGAPQ